jgi:hypothetical protein
VPVRGVIVACCLDCVLVFIVSGVVKLLLLSSPSFLKKKKKNCTSASLVVVTKVDPTMLWHKRMGHIGEKGLRAMHNKGMVE